MKKIIILNIILLLISVIYSCKKDEDIIEPENNDTIVNKIEPTGNDLINFQTTFGNENSESIIYQMEKDNNGNFYYQGKKNDEFVIGKLNTSGSTIWEQNLNFTPFDFIIDDFITIVGKQNSFGIVAVYSMSGELLSYETWNNYSKVFFNSITSFFYVYPDKSKSNNKYFIAIGGAGNSTIFPYATNFQISSSGEIEKTLSTDFPIETDKLFTDYPEMRLNKFAKYGQNGSIPIYYITTYTKQDDKLVKFSVAQFSENIYENINLGINIDWVTEINSNSSEYKVFGGNICCGYNDFGDIDGIYAVGRVEVANSSKSLNTVSSDYWTDCIAVKISGNGELLWKNEYEISDYLDGYYDCIVNNNYLYSIGNGVGYNSDNNFFGYGLVSKISTTTGNLISNKLIGQKEYKSSLNTVILHNNKLFLGGMTNFNKNNDNSTYQSWFVEFNQNGM